MSNATAETRSDSPTKPAKRRDWSMRMWEGIDFFAWLRLLARNRCAVHWRYLYIAVIVTFVSFGHTLLRLLQQLIYGRRIASTPIAEAPIFIVGHWRTGTTLLHEFLILDERHNYPNTYECMAPNHFLLTEKVFTRLFRFLTPSHRPMDNMAAGFDRPQEDEFALCMLGVPSPYLTIAFPNRPPQYPEYLDLEGIPPSAVARWKDGVRRFLQQLTFKNPKRLVLKSPPHMCRIKVLLEMFPDARFVHIVRDPHVVFPSTVNLWKSLYRTHGLQTPTFANLEAEVFQTFTRMYERLEEGRKLVPAGRFHELRYEDLIRDPLSEMRLLYERLGLDGFEQMKPRLERYLESIKGYETNRYELKPETRADIDSRWGDVIHRYGYDSTSQPPS